MSFPTTNAALAHALAVRGYTVPTAVQLAVLEANAAGRDLLVSAQTGSGKTVAFGLALGPTLLGDAERLPAPSAPMALVIAPTRELAMQVCRELTWLYEGTGARVVACVGGMDARAEARQLSGGAHIVVGTPGRLRDHLERGRLILSRLRAAVLDEADEMLNLGFREDLEFILEATNPERRTLLFSATMPREIENLARSYQRDALRIQTVRKDEQHLDIEYVAHRVAPQDVEHAVVNVLRLHEARAALVFCSTREAVNRFNARLAERGFSAVALSGELTQNERTQALQSLRDGRARVLVATDVAARGLDVPDLTLVIHAELPNDAETLLHRSGRTGRAGRKGLCVLIAPYNKRRKVDALIGAARLKVSWAPAPTPDEIRTRDQERFLADPNFTNPPTEEELQQVRHLQAGRTPDEIALALVRLHDARLPAPEDLAPDTGPPRRDAHPRDKRYQDDRRPDRFADRGERNRGDRSFKGRQEGREMVWYRLNIGRERNADPRWLLPLICRAGGVTKAEIGAIRIEDKDTRFQIAADFAEQFDLAVRTNKNKEGHIARAAEAEGERADTPPSPAAPRTFKKPFAARGDGESSSQGPHKKNGKTKWRDKKSSGWSPREREGKAPASYDRPAEASKDSVKSGGPNSKFNKKKKHRPRP